jgi:hypothetical protein
MCNISLPNYDSLVKSSDSNKQGMFLYFGNNMGESENLFGSDTTLCETPIASQSRKPTKDLSFSD